MELTLTIADRLHLIPLLPQRGGRIDMLLTAAIAEKIEFSPEEVGLYKLRDAGEGVITWNPEAAQTFTFSFTAEQVRILKQATELADQQQLITRAMLPLIAKIDALTI